MEEEKSNPIKNFLGRFNNVIFIVMLTSVLIFCIMVLKYNIGQTGVEVSDGTGIDPNQTVFSEPLKNKINKLRTSDQNSGNQTLPTGRINPFSE